MYSCIKYSVFSIPWIACGIVLPVGVRGGRVFPRVGSTVCHPGARRPASHHLLRHSPQGAQAARW